MTGVELPDRVEVARAALREIGRDDLAERVGRMGHNGHPCFWREDQDTTGDLAVVSRAIRLGHLADPDGVPVRCCYDADRPEVHIAASLARQLVDDREGQR